MQQRSTRLSGVLFAALAGLSACEVDDEGKVIRPDTAPRMDATAEVAPGGETGISDGSPGGDSADGGTDMAPDGANGTDTTPGAAADTGADLASAVCPAPLITCNTTRTLPATISQTGFFPAAPSFTTLPVELIRFEPKWQLWSDGLYKERQIILPPGKKIDITDRQRWQFPVGALFLKTFFADGTGGTRRPVETRVLRRVENEDPFKQWEFAVYQWNPDGRDAKLLDLQERVATPVMIGTAGFQHQIPSRVDCGKCHEANDTMAIGFDEARLNMPLPGQSDTQLSRLHTQGLLEGPLPATPEDVTETNVDLRALKTYVAGNCVHCHDGRNPAVVDMRPAVLTTNLVCKPTTGSGTALGWLVLPNKPDESIFYLQLARMARPGINPMPPIGVQRPDAPNVALARRWITSLRTPCP